jgi:YesN/AraC family two-component response regulator
MKAVEQHSPDLVITDLQMPGMDGLELVAKLKQAHPLIPVILITSVGNDEIAVKALKAGAATYVSKKRIAQELWETVSNVLDVSREQQRHASALLRLNRWEADFTVESDIDLVMTISGYLMQSFAAMNLCETAEQVRVGVALAEALLNAYHHGNLQLPKALRESSHAEYVKMAERRAIESPYKDRKIQITARFSRGHAIFVPVVSLSLNHRLKWG